MQYLVTPSDRITLLEGPLGAVLESGRWASAPAGDHLARRLRAVLHRPGGDLRRSRPSRHRAARRTHRPLRPRPRPRLDPAAGRRPRTPGPVSPGPSAHDEPRGRSWWSSG